MRRAASSAARLRENASTAPLDAAYAVMYGLPCVADSEAVLTMTPVPSGRCRSASRQNSAVPTRLTENSRFRSSTVSVSIGVVLWTPATFTRTSMPPSVPAASATAATTAGSSVTSTAAVVRPPGPSAAAAVPASPASSTSTA